MTSPTYGSVCSGIEAAFISWEPLRWKPLWFAEIEPFPSAVLAHHWPQVPNLGDFTRIKDGIAAGTIEAPDVLVGGTPCQAFSFAGLRESMDDARGQLTLEFVRLADAIDESRSVRGRDPGIAVWENVPGVLSTHDNAFGCFLGALAGEDGPLEPPGGRWANAGHVRGPKRTIVWRTLDAQYFGVAQRRRRVFVVASARIDCGPEVLFEFDGVRRDSPPSRQKGQGASADAGTLTSNGGGTTRPAGNCNELDFCAPVVMSTGQGGAEIAEDSAPTLTCNHEAPIGFIPPAVTFQTRGSNLDVGDVSGTLGTNCDRASGSAPMVAQFDLAQITSKANRTRVEEGLPASTMAKTSDMHAIVGTQVRRLTPVECARLQGFPDYHTRIPWRKHPSEQCPDGPQYKAYGNSMCTKVMRWIGNRLDPILRNPK